MQERLLAVLESDLINIPEASGSVSTRPKLHTQLRRILTPEDWQLIAAAAGDYVREQVMEQFQAVKTA